MVLKLYEYRWTAAFSNILHCVTNITALIDTSEMNLWLTGTLSNQGYIIHHPVHKVTMQADRMVIREKEDMINHLGTASFARILLWGYHTYTEHDLKCFPPDYHYKKDVEGSKEGLLLLKGSKRKKSSNAFVNTKDTILPNVKQIQDFLQTSIRALTGEDFEMLQCLLLDCHVLQKWTRPFSLKTKQIFGGTYLEDSTPKQSESQEAIATNHPLQVINEAWTKYKLHSVSIGKSNQDNAPSDNDEKVLEDSQLLKNPSDDDDDSDNDTSCTTKNGIPKKIRLVFNCPLFFVYSKIHKASR